MKILLHIGVENCGAAQVQKVLADKRDQLAKKGVLYPRAGGGNNHTRLYMSVTDPDAVDILRFNRGLIDPGKQDRLRQNLARDLANEVAKHDPHTLILSASQLSTLPSRSALERLRALLLPLSEDIRIIAHIDEQARVLVRHYASAILSGRLASLEQEITLAAQENWRDAAMVGWQERTPQFQGFPEVQAAPFWLDYAGLQSSWEDVFGPETMTFRPYSKTRFNGKNIVDEVRQCFDIEENIGKTDGVKDVDIPAASLTRMRAMNGLLVGLLHKGRVIPRPLWRRLLSDVAIDGPPIKAGSLFTVSKAFEDANKQVVKAHSAVTADDLKRDRKEKDWREADPEFGFRASQYVAAFLPRIDSATREALKSSGPETAKVSGLSPVAQKLMSQRARENFAELGGGRFAPHNRLGRVNEEELAPAYSEPQARTLPKGNTGRVIVGCMKDEAPYILEWIAYHRMIGVDNFIIYTNGCTDGTPELLQRLQDLGIVQHRDNNEWKGNSPQQHALNQSLKEDLIRNAEWVIHIDVDEFINVRVGNGTLDDFFSRVPDATNVAMTWRLFGHNGVTRLADDLVVDQFDHAAPKYCPKPHTVWGFKTMVKNIGAYDKLSCHRPNKLHEDKRDKVLWVNGSGQPMGEDVKEKGWRSSLKTVGYDLVQLNHYALRSAESYLIKRQRGRALHVDRSIGINYWVRMDWNDHLDITIKRNIPRVRAELERLKSDAKLLKLHEAGMEWHRAKAAELHQNPEFQDLYAKALETKLTDLERVAFSLALDLDS